MPRQRVIINLGYIYNIGKEEYADFDDKDKDINITQNMPRLFGAVAPTSGYIDIINTNILQSNVSSNISLLSKPIKVTIQNHTGMLYTHGESISHNVGIYVWGAYQVRAGTVFVLLLIS